MIHYPTRAEDRAEWARRIGGMWVTYDEEANAAYISLIGRESSCSYQSASVGNGIVLDYDMDGHLIGIELLRGALLHPSLRSSAEKLGDKSFSKTVWAPKPERY